MHYYCPSPGPQGIGHARRLWRDGAIREDAIAPYGSLPLPKHIPRRRLRKFRHRPFHIPRPRPIAMIPVVRRVRRILHIGGVAMLDRIEPAILDVLPEIALVADDVLPIAPLPDAAFAAREADGIEPLGLGQALENRILIHRQRTEKSASPGGSVQTACR